MPKRSKKSNKADKMIKVCPFCGGQWISPPSISRDVMGGQVGGINYMICNSCNKEIIPLTIKEKDLNEFKEELKDAGNIATT